jgi:hypothetical protein
VLSSCLKDQIIQSKMVLKNYSCKENKGGKLNLTNAFKNPKKLLLIYGKLLKSDVIRGSDEVNIISINLLKN